ncbi:DUF411 domain-containing protein [Janthinobacterium sp. TB1-E2]|uniref:DUF411 domain-containing protein n=1 Tax=Janthinobacterium aestuarii TaxID=2985511 RepID=A0ABZ2GGB6_9BURK|nr:DUF411 domain-containing protein [Janthinobacterium sp. GMG2]MDX8121861.1 DUF411 domain-containing protein [Janthinobacterium sp. GMG2]
MIKHLLVRGAFAAMLGLPTFAMAALPVIEVYKSASCGCCSAWIKHLETNGFTVRAKNVEMPAQYRKLAGIPDALGSCHTGLVNGYAIEGHVPASEIKQLLREKPKAKGLAVPAMPMGSPGMEGPRKDAYDVLLVKSNGSTEVYKPYK